MSLIVVNESKLRRAPVAPKLPLIEASVGCCQSAVCVSCLLRPAVALSIQTAHIACHAFSTPALALCIRS